MLNSLDVILWNQTCAEQLNQIHNQYHFVVNLISGSNRIFPPGEDSNINPKSIKKESPIVTLLRLNIQQQTDMNDSPFHQP